MDPGAGASRASRTGECSLAPYAGAASRAFPAADCQLVARPALVHRLVMASGGTYSDASRTYSELLAASGSLMRDDRRTPNQHAAKLRDNEAEALLDEFGGGCREQYPSAPQSMRPALWTSMCWERCSQKERAKHDAAEPCADRDQSRQRLGTCAHRQHPEAATAPLPPPAARWSCHAPR